MFEDKELLNTILYKERFKTYIFCVVAILVGVGLGFLNVPDKDVTDAYNSKYDNIVWTKDLCDKINYSKEGNDLYLVNHSDKDILGVTIGEEYKKIKLAKNQKEKVTFDGKITGCVINE